jgi:hypothetical protein
MEATANGKAEDWRQRIEDQRASGQSVRAWCQANGTGEHSFYWWRSRLGLSPRARRRPGRSRRQVAEGKLSPMRFAEVAIHATAEPLRLRLSGGRELILPASMAPALVAELVVALERAS